MPHQGLLAILLLKVLLLTVSPSLIGSSSQGQSGDVDAVFKTDKSSSLVLLQMLFRHGDRSPIHLFSWDENNSSWPQGSGQLTQVGMKQAYDYGGKLRQRYSDFLPPEYNQFAVDVKSTDVDRTLMTAQCLLVGLFPAKLNIWPISAWQPIPIHTLPEEMDHLFGKAPCPKLVELGTQQEKSNASQLFASKYQPLYDQLAKNIGEGVNKSLAHHISDTMYCESQHNMSKPDWMTDEIFDQLMSLRDETYAINLLSTELARFTGGPVLAEMTENMERRAKQSSSKEKLFLFSAHDTNVLSLSRAMGIFNDMQPPYLTAVIVELHQQDNNFFVRTLFDNHTDNSPYTKTIKGCVEMCPLDQFHDLLKDSMLPSANREGDCSQNSVFSFLNESIVSVMIGLILALAVAVAVLAYKLKSAKPQQKDIPNVQYRQLLQENANEDEDDDNIEDL